MGIKLKYLCGCVENYFSNVLVGDRNGEDMQIDNTVPVEVNVVEGVMCCLLFG